jgi:hypothetical protein
MRRRACQEGGVHKTSIVSEIRGLRSLISRSSTCGSPLLARPQASTLLSLSTLPPHPNTPTQDRYTSRSSSENQDQNHDWRVSVTLRVEAEAACGRHPSARSPRSTHLQRSCLPEERHPVVDGRRIIPSAGLDPASSIKAGLRICFSHDTSLRWRIPLQRVRSIQTGESFVLSFCALMHIEKRGGRVYCCPHSHHPAPRRGRSGRSYPLEPPSGWCVVMP